MSMRQYNYISISIYQTKFTSLPVPSRLSDRAIVVAYPTYEYMKVKLSLCMPWRPMAEGRYNATHY